MMILSIITINLNDKFGLIRTLNSAKVLLRKPGVEQIVIDGGSSDGSVEILERFVESYSNVKFFSGPDFGIYDAMNKGVARSHGQYLLFLNSGDEILLEDGVDCFLEQLHLIKANDIGLIGFAFEYVSADGSFLSRKRPLNKVSKRFLRMPTSHQAILFNSNLFRSSAYDTSYLISGDFAFISRCVAEDVSYLPIDKKISRFYQGGISSQRHWLLFKESASTIIRFSSNRFIVPFRLAILFLSIFIIS